MSEWMLELKGGSFDGCWPVVLPPAWATPGPVLIPWRCPATVDCEGHFTFDPFAPELPVEPAPEVYRRTALDADKCTAVYALGDTPTGEGLQAGELVGVGWLPDPVRSLG